MKWEYQDGTLAKGGDLIQWTATPAGRYYIVIEAYNDEDKNAPILIGFHESVGWIKTRDIGPSEFKMRAKKICNIPNIYSSLEKLDDI